MDRSRRRWRFVAVLAFLFILLFALPKGQSSTNLMPYIARVDIAGFIGSDVEVIDSLNSVARDEKAKAVIVYVDSPGGTMVGGLDVYNALRRMGQVKPVVCVMGTTAASAGYMVSLGCEHIIASPATLTGSIGVFMPLVDATELAEKIGVKSAAVASGSLKTATSPLEKPTDASKTYLQDMVNDLQRVFFGLVLERRQINDESKKIIADGRALTGSQALKMGLVDELGDVEDAKKWLEKHRSIAHDIPIRLISLKAEKMFFERVMSSLEGLESILSSYPTHAGAMATLNLNE